MLRKVLQKLFRKPITKFAISVSSSPGKEGVFSSLSQLLKDTQDSKSDKGVIIPFEVNSGKFIIFSDQHKGAADLADDFLPASRNYQEALKFYFENDFHFVNLGDCEELWESTPKVVIEKKTGRLYLRRLNFF